MPEVIDKSAIAEIVKLTRMTVQSVISEPIHYAVVPDGCQIKSLKDMQYPDGLKPGRITANVRLQNAESFIDYVKTYRDPRTRLFAAPGNSMKFTALLDYHTTAGAEFVSHRATYALEKDKRWQTWIASSELNMSQQQFAEFIEDNTSDIYNPPAAEMMDVARDLRAQTDSNFSSQIRLETGAVQLKYTETVVAGVGTNNVAVPEKFTIRIPVFYGEVPVEIEARLRFRASGGKVTFFYKLYRQEEILERAFNVVIATVARALEMPVWIGDSGL